MELQLAGSLCKQMNVLSFISRFFQNLEQELDFPFGGDRVEKNRSE